MAHKIDNSKGFNAFVSYQEAAWHGLGKVFNEPLTTEQALKESGLDYHVEKLPNTHILPTGESITSDVSFFTYRTDVNKILGSKLGKDYQILQNIEAMNIVDDILDKGTATIETAGAIDEGRKAFICLRVNKDIIVGSDDVINQFVLIATSHDGTMSITATPTNVRVVCNNTLTAALRNAKGAVKIRHTSNANVRLNEAMKVMKLINDNTAINTDNYNQMKQNVISSNQMFDYFGNVFCTKEEINELRAGKNAKETLSTRKQNILNDVLTFSNNGIGQNLALNNGELNMWHAYNAVTGYITSKKYSSIDDRANSMLFGSAATKIEDAGVLAATPSMIIPMHRQSSIIDNVQLN